MDDYINYLFGYVDVLNLKFYYVVVNVGNGGVGMIVDVLEFRLLFKYIKLLNEFDGYFFNGVFNLLLKENCDVICVVILE